MAAAVTLAVVPSGKVTLTDEPGSAVPDTVSVPFGLAATAEVGGSGAEVSVYGVATAVEVLPAGSVVLTDVDPEGCGVAEVAE